MSNTFEITPNLKLSFKKKIILFGLLEANSFDCRYQILTLLPTKPIKKYQHPLENGKLWPQILAN